MSSLTRTTLTEENLFPETATLCSHNKSLGFTLHKQPAPPHTGSSFLGIAHLPLHSHLPFVWLFSFLSKQSGMNQSLPPISH